MTFYMFLESYRFVHYILIDRCTLPCVINKYITFYLIADYVTIYVLRYICLIWWSMR